MGDKNNDQTIMDKSMRSVFVGNIPYEATEDKLKEIFNEVGPVLSLKLVFDRESGKPKGYGFCEYKDQETALSAMRNLNGYEIGGRTLRVDNACTEKSRMEMQQLLQGPQVENPYGEVCTPEQAPEQITKTVASLPPEQMFELMKQMKTCIQNNPTEARQMLLQNPQLAYALLQAQVVMRIVDPQRAVTMLHKANVMPPVLGGQPLQPNQQQQSMHVDPMIGMGVGVGMPMPVPAPQVAAGVAIGGSGDVDLRSVIDPRLPVGAGIGAGNVPLHGRSMMDQDMRGVLPHDGGAFQRNIPPPQQQQRGIPTGVAAPFQSSVDPRQRPIDPRVKMQQQQQQQQQPPPGMPTALQQPPPGMPQSVIASAVGLGGSAGANGGGAAAAAATAAAAAAARTQQQQMAAAGGAISNNASDQEKAALIMQVLQLSDEQIAMLPPEQRASILVLKGQIAKSTQR